MSDILKTAILEIGTKEIKGSSHNEKIIQYAKEAGMDWVNDDETPWCSTFVNWCAKQSGLELSGKANARSWMDVGDNVDSDPIPGDIVIFWRGSKDSWKGHVGIFMGFDKSNKFVFTLGGNQSNSVNISRYKYAQVLGFRRLEKDNVIKLPLALMMAGDKGDSVKDLQNCMINLGYDLGKWGADSDYGNATTNAISLFQSDNALSVTGRYDEATENSLHSKLSE